MHDALYESLLAALVPYGQEHLLRFWNELDDDQREQLAGDIRGIDFGLVGSLYLEGRKADQARRDQRNGDAGRVSDESFGALVRRMSPPPAFRLDEAAPRFTREEARRCGAEALRAGQVGVILVAGGQGTRLKFPHAKGMFPIGPVSGNSLFQILLEKILAQSRRYDTRIPLFMMTSPATHAETDELLSRNARFGLPEDDVTLFCQGTMPAVDAESGRVLLAERHRVALSPDGHGGTVAALAGHGCLDEMRRRGVRHLFYLQVDNPLVDVCSPELLGYHVLCESGMSTQVVAKRTAGDRLGNVVQADGRLHVIEYIHWNQAIALRPEAADPSVFWAGSIGVHGLDRAFLERASAEHGSLSFHVSERKKVDYVDAGGHPVRPDAPNAFKFERFIFDLMPSARNAVVVEVEARSSFAPLKNAPGKQRDTPKMVRAQMVAIHTEWLRRAGADVAEGVPVEISPLCALDAEELAAKIAPKTRVTEPTYFE
jgi:UDP-N-acetylglucosamine/UDP-N-acetylgalactosamine diphosphorylase